jgi:isoquinoline 1-oxidoreductase beta subunit
MLHRIDAVLGDDGLPQSIAHKVVSPSMLRYAWPRGVFPNLADATQAIDPPAEMDLMPVEGVLDSIYAIRHQTVDFHRQQPEIPASIWRTTGHGPNNWALESVIDDCAHVAGADPVAYRRRLLAGSARMLRLLDMLAEKAGLDSPPPQGEGRGIALASAFGSLIAQAVTLTVDDKSIRFRRVVSVADLGEVLDPVIATRNIEGGVIWGLSALRTEATFTADGPAVANFDQFDPIHLWETPAMETYFIDGGGKPGGVGEVGPVPTLAAVCNAIFAASGVRIRELPISKAGWTIA